MTRSKPKAVCYHRVSSIGQESGDGFERQRESTRAYAEREGLRIVATYEECYTGTSDLEDRMHFSKLVERVQRGDIDFVLIESSDRLARKLVVSEKLLGVLSEENVSVIACSMGIDLTDDDDPGRVLIRQVLAAMAEWDKSNLVQRLAKARHRIKQTTGKCEGRKLYGEGKGENVVVQRMLQLRDSGASYLKIADVLNSSGSRNSEGNHWKAPTVGKILRRVQANT